MLILSQNKKTLGVYQGVSKLRKVQRRLVTLGFRQAVEVFRIQNGQSFRRIECDPGDGA